MAIAYLGLGSNVGDREKALTDAVRELGRCRAVCVRRWSSVYETEPIGPQDQAWFLNAVVEVETDLDPRDLLRQCKRIETVLGRRPRDRWGPREIDIDILVYGSLCVASPDLIIPHPQLEARAFVLVPLAELVPDMLLPSGRTVRQALARLSASYEVRRHEWVLRNCGDAS